ncbi:transmembrane protein 246 [Parus major]|uniref:transmembrane protein 246 n=1 Tax=Parus major TaxID=9157 RepID=UPI00077153A4|nr:transmembrane protein 246 [Parus major]
MLNRAWQLCGKWCRWSSPFIHLLTLTVVTFAVLAPLICHRLLHSYFYLRRWHLNPMSQEFLEQNQQEGQDALHYFEKMQMPNASEVSGSEAFQPVLLITIKYLQGLHCHQGFAKDTALYSLLRGKGENAFVVEPNLVRHVGMYSSLRLNSNPKLL